MAIQLDKTSADGFTADFWFLSGISLDRDTLTAKGIFRLYKSKADKAAGTAAIGHATATVDITGASMTITQMVTALETKVREEKAELDGGSAVAD